jgi:hypothetical protein
MSFLESSSCFTKISSREKQAQGKEPVSYHCSRETVPANPPRVTFCVDGPILSGVFSTRKMHARCTALPRFKGERQ